MKFGKGKGKKVGKSGYIYFDYIDHAIITFFAKLCGRFKTL